MRNIWLVLSIAACSKGEQRPQRVEPQTPHPVAETAAKPAPEKPAGDIPAWAPIDNLDGAPAACVAHQLVVKASGTYARPPQKTLDKDQRIMW